MAIKRLLNQDAQPKELAEEISLRPRSFKEYVGQERLKKNLQLAIEACRERQEPLDHILLYGPPGLGKTTMAGVVAAQMGVPMRSSSGPAIGKAAELVGLMTGLKKGDILFIDEIHRLGRPVEEVLYGIMEDFKLDIILGKGAAAKSLRLDLAPFTLIAATTQSGALSAPLRDRFDHIHRLEFYAVEEIARIITRSAGILKVQITPEAARLLAERSRLTPRIANRLLRRVRDYSQIKASGAITLGAASGALEMLAIDNLGLDSADRLLLSTISEHHAGGPVGLSTLAAMLGDEPQTVEEHFEPFLLQAGLLERSPRGRCLTAKAKRHLRSLKDSYRD